MPNGFSSFEKSSIAYALVSPENAMKIDRIKVNAIRILVELQHFLLAYGSVWIFIDLSELITRLLFMRALVIFTRCFYTLHFNYHEGRYDLPVHNYSQ